MPVDWWVKCKLSFQSHHHDWANWLYDTYTIRCGCGDARDNDPSTFWSKLVFPVFCVLAAAAVVAVSRPRGSHDREHSDGKMDPQGVAECGSNLGHWGEDNWSPQPTGIGNADGQASTGQLPADAEDDGTRRVDSKASLGSAAAALRPVQKERLWYIDYARIVCVACVVTEHSGGEVYAERNIAWVQQWVLPYLYTISGMSFMFSSGSIWSYLLRLTVVFIIGTLANFIADVISARDWKNDFYNTAFQMAYIVIIGLLSLFLAPLRNSLRWRDKNPMARPKPQMIAWTVCWGVVATVFIALMISGVSLVDTFRAQTLTESGARPFILYGPYVMATYVWVFFLCFLACVLSTGGWAVWIILAFIYITRMVIPYTRGGHPLYAELFAVGMLSQKVPLQGTATVARRVREYWPLMFAALLLLSTPGVTGRCDLHPHYQAWGRVRFYTIEWILIVLLLTGVFNTSDTLQITGWLNMWALYAYCFHVFWARVLPHPSHGAICTYAAIPVFYFVHSGRLKCRRRRS